ncbi:MAG: LptE family protein [Candidatus Aureabacteria bacterium]|nr:LptE family protein [Candidatus Auribacterota bacterium]
MKYNPAHRLIIACCISLSLLSGCGYKAGSLILDDYRTIAIPVFRNETYQEDIESYLTDAVIDQFQRDGSLIVSDKKDADLLLKGRITGWRRTGERFAGDEYREVVEYQMEITMAFDLLDQKTGDYIFKDVKISGKNTYFVNPNIPASKKRSIPLEREQQTVIISKDIYESEKSSMWRAAERISRQILQKVVERW